MNRKHFSFRQKVTETELNDGIDAAENAQVAASIDNGFRQNADGSNVPFASPNTGDFNSLKGGIARGLNVTVAGLNATVSTGVAYDQQGRRVSLATPVVVDLSATGDTAIGSGGTPAGGFATTVPGGQTRWITLMVYFDRALSDPRVDGNGDTVFFNEDESFHFRVKAGNAAASSPVKASLDANMIVIGDFLRNDSNVITSQEYNRRGDWLRMSATDPTTVPPVVQAENGTTTDPAFIAGNPRDAAIKLRNMITQATGNYVGHINQSAPVDRHAAKNIDFSAVTTAWPDGTTPSLANHLGGGANSDGVQGAFNELITDLAAKTGVGGSQRIGSVAISGTPTSLPATNVHDHESILLTAINGHVTDASDAHDASAISATPAGTRSTTDVQSQLGELDTNKMGLLMPWLFGDGLDGDVILNTPGVTEITTDKSYNNLSITNGAILATRGHVVRVANTLTIGGSDGSYIHEYNGTGTGKNGLDATLSSGGTGGGGWNSIIIGASGNASTLLGGENGGTGGSNTNGAAGLAATDSLGGNGAAGGDATGGHTGGAQGTITSLAAQANVPAVVSTLHHPGFLFGVTLNGGVPSPRVIGIKGGAGGGGGGGNGVGGGGGGGAGGGVLIVFARKIVTQNGTEFKCVGGKGGNGAAGGGASGGGGGGGCAILVWQTITTPPTYPDCVAGGLSGTGTGTSSGGIGAVGTLFEYVIHTG